MIILVAITILLAPAFHSGPILTLDNVAVLGHDGLLLGLVLPATWIQRILIVGAVLPGLIGVTWLSRVRSMLALMSIALFWITNIFLVERLAVGQWQLLIAVGALPWLLAIVEAWWHRPRLRLFVAATLIGVTLITIYPRSVSFLELVLIAGLAVPWLERGRNLSHYVWRALIIVATIGVGSLVLHRITGTVAGARLEGATDVAQGLFAIDLGSPILSLLGVVNYLGFWAEQAGRLPFLLTNTWLAFVPAFIFLPVAIVGWRQLLIARRALGIALIALYCLSFLLVASSIPSSARHLITQSLDWLGFVGLRETGKFMGGMLVAQAVGIAVGVVVLWQRRTAGRVAIGALAAMLILWLPIALGTSRWALTPVVYPPELIELARTTNVSGEGAILFPWHRYQAYPFTHGRVVDQLAPNLFSRTVFNELVEYGPLVTTSADPWQQLLLQATSTDLIDDQHLSEALKARSITVVVIMKTNDFDKYMLWAEQHQLALIADTPALSAYRISTN